MKILFCSDAMVIDGVTSYILHLGTALKMAGHDIAVVGRWGGVKGFQRRYREAGFKTICCPSITVGNFYFDYMAKKFAHDLIMTDSRRSFPLATRLKKITGAKIITYFLDALEKLYKKGRDINSLIKFSDAWVSFEEDILRQMRNTAPDFKIFELTRPLDIMNAPVPLAPKEPFKILCFGRLSKYKTPGIFYLIQNLDKFINIIPNVEIYILGGSGWRFFKIKMLAKKINKRIGRECIKMLGTIDNPHTYFQEANLVLSAATSAMEAAISKRPVIAMSWFYFGHVTPENLNDAVKSFFAERLQENVHSFEESLIDDINTVYKNYGTEKFIADLDTIFKQLKEDFSYDRTIKQFNEILKVI